MRLDHELCDVTFQVSSSKFPAHRVVLSCCSRWLKSLLAAKEGDGVIVLDSLDPGAVQAVIAYLYGEPLHFTPALSEEVIRVIRTFELDEVEIRCWKYLVGAVTTRNCVWLHRLADAYDCPALKWQSWRAIKQVLGAYENQPINVLGRQFEDDEEEDVRQPRPTDVHEDPADDSDYEESDGEADDLGRGRSLSAVQASKTSHFLPSGGTKPRRAKSVIMDWAKSLQKEWEACEPILTEKGERTMKLLKGELPVEWYRNRLMLFYEEHNPDKIQTIDIILDEWQGKEDELLKAVVDKYKTKYEHNEAAAVYDQVGAEYKKGRVETHDVQFGDQ
ncbi:hypothetical protein TL16_g00523 [Triparma laevis f. inornata]|uniref:BTB domain-containing protein n=1 Tax=Triparma laevis f. inornata TaxID=1714386 RepID=A0A9W6ZFL8_9STRA|nr:hypothetical protein TL16_g00523 [Triparma laevis f. inornata]